MEYRSFNGFFFTTIGRTGTGAGTTLSATGLTASTFGAGVAALASLLTTAIGGAFFTSWAAFAFGNAAFTGFAAGFFAIGALLFAALGFWAGANFGLPFAFTAFAGFLATGFDDRAGFALAGFFGARTGFALFFVVVFLALAAAFFAISGSVISVGDKVEKHVTRQSPIVDRSVSARVYICAPFPEGEGDMAR